MTDKVYAHGSVIQMSGMNHVIGVMANDKQAEDVARIINAHDDLVAALKLLFKTSDEKHEKAMHQHNPYTFRECNTSVCDIVDAALAKAGAA